MHTDDTENNNDEIVYDEDSSVDTIKKLRARLKESEKEAKEYLDALQRMKADVVNRDKEFKERELRISAAVTEQFLEDLLPVLDSFESAFKGSSWQSVDLQWRVGVEYIFNQLQRVLSDRGISAFGNVGERFDPLVHDLDGEPGENISMSTVANVIRKGYKIGERIIRPARVTVL